MGQMYFGCTKSPENASISWPQMSFSSRGPVYIDLIRFSVLCQSWILGAGAVGYCP